MRLLFVADGRSPIALNWISYFVAQGHEVHLASTYACAPQLPLASLEIVPVAFSSAKSGPKTGRPASGASIPAANGRSRSASPQGIWSASAVELRTSFRQWFGPLTLPLAARRLKPLIARLQPDLVHAMRIPYEGMLAALCKPEMPLLISTWGNDFTLHAPSTPLMGYATRQALKGASAVHSDCQRDIRLAQAWGFPAGRPSIVLPGAGGIQTDLFFPPEKDQDAADEPPVIVNPRGIRAYVRNDTFFQAIPLVLERYPQARFLCPTMAGQAQPQQWVESLGIVANVELLPHQTRTQMAELFRRSQIVVSITTHDGTPNTLLEGMACGCLPIAGDIESVREWITPGVNGLLVDPGDAQALAGAIISALEQPVLRRNARAENVRLIGERAAYARVMPLAFDFYQKLIKN